MKQSKKTTTKHCPLCDSKDIKIVNWNNYLCRSCKNGFHNKAVVTRVWTTHKVQACWDSEFNGIECLESKDQWGFFKSPNDRRPSSCRWVDKIIDKSKQTKLTQFKIRKSKFKHQLPLRIVRTAIEKYVDKKFPNASRHQRNNKIFHLMSCYGMRVRGTYIYTTGKTQKILMEILDNIKGETNGSIKKNT